MADSSSQPDYSAGSAYHLARRKYAPSTVAALQTVLGMYAVPESVIDMGCGADGVTVHHLASVGVLSVGVDIGIEDQEYQGLRHADLRVPLDLGFSADWVLCWEVAEHLPESSSAVLVDTLARHLARPTGRLFFTAAQPFQAGPGHINCKPKEYWRVLFEAHGLRYQARETHRLMDAWMTEGIPAWYRRNLQIFAWA